MKWIGASILAILSASSLLAQQEATSNHVSTPANSFKENSDNLPVEKIGQDDLLGITVYDSPELTRTVRVDTDGAIRLPMLKKPILAAGLLPNELEKTITDALKDGNVLVDPIVTVSVVEYRSRPIAVVGAVKTPLTFQATGTVTLLDAISRAGGLSENAGADILVSRQQSRTDSSQDAAIRRISVNSLISGEDPTLNLRLDGGEEVRVPEAGRVFVLGDVKKPGAFYITEDSESSVLKALSLSEGLEPFPSHKAYIYRLEAGKHGRSEIPIELKKILNRKSPDVPLIANDILYIPNATGARASVKVLETSLGLAAGLGAAVIYTTR